MTGPRPAFAWDEAMAAGMGLLRLSPSAFWAMTPRELSAALSAFLPSRAAPGRAVLSALMTQYPDRGDA